eukprot:TRINITY_DN2283_c0_g1_i8.p1 TRINITY_DN2283_c0_g1~~TRINITY_DN2283_c0_g1_i8.p1  ORF type:complete len:864 (+),score=258.43 TRINITY_DN2283_c0_g1_i8:64-2592(+)
MAAMPPGSPGSPTPVIRTPPSLETYNVRTLRCGHRVTVMKRFQAFMDRQRPFEARATWRKHLKSIQALHRLGQKHKPRELSADMLLVTGHEGGLLQVRNFDTGEIIGSGQHYNEATVTCIQVTNSYVYTAVEKRVRRGSSAGVTGSEQCDIYVWDLSSMGEVAHTLEGHTDRVCCLAAPPWNELTPVSGSLDKTIIVWDVSKGRRPVHILRGHGMMVKHLLLGRESIVSASSDQSIRVWSWDGKETAKYDSAHSGPIFFLSYGTTPETVVSACGGGLVRESSLDKGALRELWHNKAAKGQILDVAFDDKYVASSSLETSAINFYIRSQKDNRKLQLHEQPVRTLEMDGQRQCLMSGSDDGVVVVWDYHDLDKGRTPTSLLQVQAHKASIVSIILERDLKGCWERMFTTAGDQTVFVIDFVLDRGSRSHDVKRPATHAVGIPRTNTVVTAHGHECLVWNASKKEHKANYTEGGTGYLRVHDERIVGLRYSAEEQKLVSVSEEGFMQVWDVSFYDEVGMKMEELIAPADKLELKHPCKCLSPCFGQAIGVGMSKLHHHGGVVAVHNYVSMSAISHFFTNEPPLAVSFLGTPNEEITQVLVQFADHEAVLYDLDGKAIRAIAPALEGAAKPPLEWPVVPYLEWQNTKYDPPQHMVILAKGDLVKECTVVLDGGKNVLDVKTNWGARCPAYVTCSALIRQAGMYCVAGLQNGTFRIWDNYGELLHSISWDGSTSSEAEVRDIPPGRLRRLSFANAAGSTHHSVPASAVTVSLQQRFLALGFADGSVHLWDMVSRRNTKRIFAHSAECVRLLHIIGRRLVSTTDNRVRFDNLEVREDFASQPQSPGR